MEDDEDEDNEMEITFDHHCSKCGHKICQHFYSYQLDNGYHKYLMECQLCGRGAYEQFAGIKQLYPQSAIDELENQKNEETDKNEKSEKITLDLSSMQQLNIHSDENEEETKDNNTDDDDEWND